MTTAEKTMMPQEFVGNRSFVFAREIDRARKSRATDARLRHAGTALACDLSIPATATLETFKIEVKAVLAKLVWGYASFDLDVSKRVANIVHFLLPAFEPTENCGLSRLLAVFEGLYSTWFNQQPDADRRPLGRQRPASQSNGSVMFIYGRMGRTEKVHTAFSTQV